MSAILQPGRIDESQIPAAIQWLNTQHALIFDGSTTLVWSSVHDEVLDRHVWKQAKLSDFRAFYDAYQCADGSKWVSLADVWLKHPDARRFRGVVFDPTMRKYDSVMNLWRGFAVKPDPSHSWDRLKEHLFEIVADRDDTSFRYLMGWMARMIQFPAEPAGTAIVLRGEQGVGKGVAVHSLGRLLGPHFCYISQTGQLTNRFNAHFADALLVFADEAVWAGDRSGDGVLKSLITEPYLSIERKNRDLITMKNMVHLIMASNQEWVAPVGRGDRRYFVLDVSDRRRKDVAYFNAIAAEQRNGGAGAMLHELSHFDLSHYRSSEFPETEGRADQILASLEPFEKWWVDRLLIGMVGQTSMVSGFTIDNETLYGDYVAQMKHWNQRYIVNLVWFGRKMTRLVPTMKNLKGFQSRTYVFPDLLACREDFERVLGCAIDWTKDERHLF